MAGGGGGGGAGERGRGGVIDCADYYADSVKSMYCTPTVDDITFVMANLAVSHRQYMKGTLLY